MRREPLQPLTIVLSTIRALRRKTEAEPAHAAVARHAAMGDDGHVFNVLRCQHVGVEAGLLYDAALDERAGNDRLVERLILRGRRPGIPDVVLLEDGRIFWIEPAKNDQVLATGRRVIDHHAADAVELVGNAGERLRPERRVGDRTIDPVQQAVVVHPRPRIDGPAASGGNADSMRASSTCDRTPSFSKQRARCVLTVAGETPSTCAACGPLRPPPISVATRASAAVSPKADCSTVATARVRTPGSMMRTSSRAVCESSQSEKAGGGSGTGTTRSGAAPDRRVTRNGSPKRSPLPSATRNACARWRESAARSSGRAADSRKPPLDAHVSPSPSRNSCSAAGLAWTMRCLLSSSSAAL